MNKKYLNILTSFFILILLFEIFDHSAIVSKTIYNSSIIWFYNLIPSILPIYIIIDLLLNYNILNYISILLNPIMKYLFKMKKNTSYVFLLSILSGFPSNSKYIKNLLDSNEISLFEANKLLIFTHFSNPLFIINSIGINFLQNKKIGILILISHYLTNIIIGFINRNYYVNLNNNTTNIKSKKSSFITTLTNSIYNTFKILILLYGIITIFMIITSIININLKLNPILNSIICGILEMTSGIYYASKLIIPINLKASLITFFLSFGGISIHVQVFSILSDYKLKYKDYLKARITHAIISASIIYIFLSLGYNK